jgi:hypothetical protein
MEGIKAIKIETPQMWHRLDATLSFQQAVKGIWGRKVLLLFHLTLMEIWGCKSPQLVGQMEKEIEAHKTHQSIPMFSGLQTSKNQT